MQSSKLHFDSQNSSKQPSFIPVDIVFGEMAYSFSILEHWSINKIKCLIATEIPKLDFDQFELSLHENLLRGNYSLKQVVEGLGQVKNERVRLDIIRTASHIKFRDFYRQKMGRILQVAQKADQPVLNMSYQRSMNLLNKSENENEMQNNPPNLEDELREIEGENDNQPALFTVLRIFGIYLFINLLSKYGSFYQISIIVLVVIFYGIIEWQRRVNRVHIQRNRNQQNNNNQAQKNRNRIKRQRKTILSNQIKAEILLRAFKAAEIMFVFVCSFFPNWDIRVHLHRNAQYLKKAKLMVDRYVPETFGEEEGAENPQQQKQEQQIINQEEVPAMHLEHERQE